MPTPDKKKRKKMPTIQTGVKAPARKYLGTIDQFTDGWRVRYRGFSRTGVAPEFNNHPTDPNKHYPIGPWFQTTTNAGIMLTTSHVIAWNLSAPPGNIVDMQSLDADNHGTNRNLSFMLGEEAADPNAPGLYLPTEWDFYLFLVTSNSLGVMIGCDGVNHSWFCTTQWYPAAMLNLDSPPFRVGVGEIPTEVKSLLEVRGVNISYDHWRNPPEMVNNGKAIWTP